MSSGFSRRVGPKASTVRLTFGDTPDPGEAERVAEIAHAKVWADGVPLEVERLPDGLEAKLPPARPRVLECLRRPRRRRLRGDSFVITLAAYAQIRAAQVGRGPEARPRRRPAPPAPGRRRGRHPEGAGDLAGQARRGDRRAVVPRRRVERREDRRQRRDALPELGKAGVSLLAQFREMTPGVLGGKKFTHTRYKATLNLVPAPAGSTETAVEEQLSRVQEIHGGTGPWAVAGYRIGERALKELGLPRHSFRLLVVHRSPAEVQYSCVADGLQAATGRAPASST